ncbi:nickel-binding protein [Sphingomonas mesophila]|uniref:nickel-binding protein n=1 Tax=Sphingomonas mesophila TaxID=2303576 RepID=UPI000E58392D|nr:nickel-binding protein [Sphingomonas mesophila]
MPLYLDIHTVPGATAEDLRKAHEADVAVQSKYGVDYRKYWLNEKCGKVFCLVEAPSAEAAHRVHAESHGLVAEKIIEVDPDMIDGFLGDAAVNDAGAAVLPASGVRDTAVRSVMFTDVVGSTELAQRLGDDIAFELISTHDSIVRGAVTEHGGRVIKHTGDGIMAVFVSPVQMVKAACTIQTVVTSIEPKAEHPPFQVRIGGAAGEPIERDNDFFGTTVNLAARLCAAAEPARVLVSNGVAELCLGKGMKFADLRYVTLKGFDEDISTREVVITC